MEIKVSLKEHNVYKWEQKDNISLRKGFFKDIDVFANEEELIEQVKGLNGVYAAVIKTDKFYYLVGDRFQSFPILYYVDSKQVIVSDSLGLIEKETNLVVNKNNLHEFIAMGVVTGCETLYNNLFVVEAGQIVRINRQSGEIYKIDYYMHRHFNDYTNKSFDELKDELDKLGD